MAIVIKYELTGTEALTRIQVIHAVKEALHTLGLFWWAGMLPKHFTEQAYAEYGFRRRTIKYDRWKRKVTGSALPLVGGPQHGHPGGEGRAEALSPTTSSRIRATRDTVTIPLPRKFNLSNPKGPKMSDEVRAVSKAELPILEARLVQEIEAELDAAVPAGQRNRGFIGGRVQRLKLTKFRPPANRAPVARRTAV